MRETRHAQNQRGCKSGRWLEVLQNNYRTLNRSALGGDICSTIGRLHCYRVNRGGKRLDIHMIMLVLLPSLHGLKHKRKIGRCELALCLTNAS